MAYIKTNWVARVGTALNRFLKTNETSTEVELTNDPTGVTTAGTPFTVANMNHIEQGIYDNDQRLDQSVKTTDTVEFANYASKTLASGTGVDLDDVITSGFYYIPIDASNSPIASYCSLTVSRNSDIISQTLIPADQDYFYYRSGNPTEVGGIGSWRAWKQVTQSDQNLRTTDSPTFASVNTGQGANELYAMNQNVRTTDSVHFANMNPPVDNNDASMPSVGIGGFSYAVGSTSQEGDYPSISIGSGGTWVCIASSGKFNTSDYEIRMYKVAGGSSIQGLIAASNVDAYLYVIAWRIA